MQVPAGTTAGQTLVMTVIADATKTDPGSFSEIAFNCSTGAISSSLFNRESSDRVEPPFGGPPIPEGFVLRTITCDSPVFDLPGGQPVGENRVLAGQSWYVNPNAVTGPDGESWTAVFVSGEQNPFIPTVCVGGYPPDAPGGDQYQ